MRYIRAEAIVARRRAAVDVTMWLAITLERREKCLRVLSSLGAGWPEPCWIVEGEPPDDDKPVAVWGQIWLAETVIPKCIVSGRPFWQVDNGFYEPARGQIRGYHRVCYRGLSPVMMDKPDMARGPKPAMKPWRRDGRHVVLALPGEGFGRSIGLDMPAWIAGARAMIEAVTDRPIYIRPKVFTGLEKSLHDAWCLVTHSSNVAVDAVIAGVPVFVAPTNPAAPVGNLDLAQIENPAMPDRERWWSSLMSQQFSLDEMMAGLPYRYLSQVREQVDQCPGITIRT